MKLFIRNIMLPVRKKIAAKINTKKDKKLNDMLEKQIQLLTICKTKINANYDALIDAERIMEEQSIDDVFGISVMKREMKDLVDKLFKWDQTVRE